MSLQAIPTANEAGLVVSWRAFLGAFWRNNLRLKRNTASIVSAFVIPGLFMLSFWAVFGHAANQAGMDYALFLLAACMFQAVMFTAGGSAMALGVDSESGLLERMRAMPIPAWVAIAGRLACDMLRSICSLVTVLVIALLCGAEPDSVMSVVWALVMALITGEIMGMFFSGLALRSKEPVAAAGVIQGIEMPLLMFSTAFIPLSSLPDWLEPIVKHLPFSPLIDSIRALLTGADFFERGWEAIVWLAFGLITGTWWVSRAFRRA